MIILGFQHTTRTVQRGLSRRFSSIVKDTMFETAEFWHQKLFPKHFGPRNRSEYSYERRNPFYLSVIKPLKGQGEGRFRDEVLSGRSSLNMRFLYKVAGTARKVQVRMNPESYFTRPFVGTWVDAKTGKTRSICRQPDKPDEVTRFSEDDKQALREFSQETLNRKLAESRIQFSSQTITIGG